MSKGALHEMLSAHPEKFIIMVKQSPNSEKPEILKFLQSRLTLLRNLK